MAHIKKMVMQGFKSFAKKTEIPFDKGINVFVGPNGAGKSNLIDSLCFVLGRLSVKSMRAAKAKNLIFMGSKQMKPAKEAYVELVFDNSDRSFGIDKDEICLKRIVKFNGQSVYKINDNTKTRGEVIEMLAHAGIDPHGFNIILQGQIQSIVKMRGEERRKIIEEVAGISIYESRKEKSLRELGKTEERLKEISTILRERGAYLRNLEKEKAQAERYKELENTIKRSKASIIHKKRDEKLKETQVIIKSIDQGIAKKEKTKEQGNGLQSDIEKLNVKINEINKHIQSATGLEQEELHNNIANLRAELEGFRVRKESYENRQSEIERRIQEMKKDVPEIGEEIKNLREESPKMAEKAAELRKKKQELQEIEIEKRKAYGVKTELNSLKERIRDRESQLAKTQTESISLLKEIEHVGQLAYEHEEEYQDNIAKNKISLTRKRKELKNCDKIILEKEKNISVLESEINRNEEIKRDVKKLDICPLCQSKISDKHISHVFKDSNGKIQGANRELEKLGNEIRKSEREKQKLIQEMQNLEEFMGKGERELINFQIVREKKTRLRKAVNEEHELKEQIKKLAERRAEFEKRISELSNIEERYESKILEIEEISSRTEEDIDTTLLYKERELEKTLSIIKRSDEDLGQINTEIEEIGNVIEKKEEALEEKEAQDKELQKKFNKMFSEREETQKTIQEKNLLLSEIQNEIRQIDDQVNYLKIGKAKLDAESESLEMEMHEFVGVELMKGSIKYFEERLKRAQENLQYIGSINMRALEVYEEVKKSYEVIYEKVETLEKEKQEVLNIIKEIDNKKKRTFMKTFRAINDIFMRNFSKLSTKGTAYLELENKENIFDGGINIVVKLAKGKYFDVSSLSGGEQTLIALSLLFAIQEHNPYHFYILDEIDAALDKRNSERLASLLQQYMKSGQYIVITHNDALLVDSNILYGVSMHDSISKILSLRV